MASFELLVDNAPQVSIASLARTPCSVSPPVHHEADRAHPVLTAESLEVTFCGLRRLAAGGGP
jgi:hypothetical protein